MVRRLLDEWLECAADMKCIAPAGVSRKNHNFDQSALSILFWKHGFACERDQHSYGGDFDLSHNTFIPTLANDLVFALRRWREPRPFTTFLQFKEGGFESSPPFSLFNFSASQTGIERDLKDQRLLNAIKNFTDFMKQSVLCSTGFFATFSPFLFLLLIYIRRAKF